MIKIFKVGFVAVILLIVGNCLFISLYKKRNIDRVLYKYPEYVEILWVEEDVKIKVRDRDTLDTLWENLDLYFTWGKSSHKGKLVACVDYYLNSERITIGGVERIQIQVFSDGYISRTDMFGNNIKYYKQQEYVNGVIELKKLIIEKAKACALKGGAGLEYYMKHGSSAEMFSSVLKLAKKTVETDTHIIYYFSYSDSVKPDDEEFGGGSVWAVVNKKSKKVEGVHRKVLVH